HREILDHITRLCADGAFPELGLRRRRREHEPRRVRLRDAHRVWLLRRDDLPVRPETQRRRELGRVCPFSAGEHGARLREDPPRLTRAATGDRRAKDALERIEPRENGALWLDRILL